MKRNKSKQKGKIKLNKMRNKIRNNNNEIK